MLLRSWAHDRHRTLWLIQTLDFTARLSTATASQVSELSAQLAHLRTQFLGARPFLPPYDQRQYEMVTISFDVLDAIIDTVSGIQATEIMGTSSGETTNQPKFCWHQTKIFIQAQGQVRDAPIRRPEG